MSKLEELEKEFKKNIIKKSLLWTIKDTVDSSIKEMQKTVSFIFNTSNNNQISKEQENKEILIVSKRKHN